jgi:hypothetical protein
MMPARTSNEFSSPVKQVNASNNPSLASSKLNSSSPNINTINHKLLSNQMIMRTSEDVFHENQIIKQIESTRVSATREHSFIQPRHITDKAEKHEQYSIKENFSPLQSM